MRELRFHMLDLQWTFSNRVPHMPRQPASIERSMHLPHRPVCKQHRHQLSMRELRCQLFDLFRPLRNRVPHMHRRPESPRRRMYLS